MDDLQIENRELRKQLVELAKCMRDVQNEAIQEDISYELKALLSDVNYFVRSASIILAGLLTFVSLLDSSSVGRDYVRLLAGK